MKLRSTLLLLIILIALCVNGQESKKYLKIKKNRYYTEGILILKDSSRVEGLIKDNSLGYDKIFSSLIFVCKNGEKVTIQGDGSCVRAFLHAFDTALDAASIALSSSDITIGKPP